MPGMIEGSIEIQNKFEIYIKKFKPDFDKGLDSIIDYLNMNDNWFNDIFIIKTIDL